MASRGLLGGWHLGASSLDLSSKSHLSAVKSWDTSGRGGGFLRVGAAATGPWGLRMLLPWESDSIFKRWRRPLPGGSASNQSDKTTSSSIRGQAWSGSRSPASGQGRASRGHRVLPATQAGASRSAPVASAPASVRRPCCGSNSVLRLLRGGVTSNFMCQPGRAMVPRSVFKQPLV